MGKITNALRKYKKLFICVFVAALAYFYDGLASEQDDSSSKSNLGAGLVNLLQSSQIIKTIPFSFVQFTADEPSFGSSEIVLADPSDGCSPHKTETDLIRPSIVVVDSLNCNVHTKLFNAQSFSNIIALLVCNAGTNSTDRMDYPEHLSHLYKLNAYFIGEADGQFLKATVKDPPVGFSMTTTTTDNEFVLSVPTNRTEILHNSVIVPARKFLASAYSLSTFEPKKRILQAANVRENKAYGLVLVFLDLIDLLYAAIVGLLLLPLRFLDPLLAVLVSALTYLIGLFYRTCTLSLSVSDAVTMGTLAAAIAIAVKIVQQIRILKQKQKLYGDAGETPKKQYRPEWEQEFYWEYEPQEEESKSEDQRQDEAEEKPKDREAQVCAYKLLGLSEGATLVQLNAAKNKLAMKLHPDKNTNESEAVMLSRQEELKAVLAAYEQIKDGDKQFRANNK